ncbi:FAD binding domain-containing protein [Desulforhopalus singaporensis]|uniref:Carbon-monoxide dehydrogenase medium subunit n=1 Tax=Desulforhopalus singaporensis TaxID=91360 RepID=A0A1H0RSC5_9BACT|nr:xanthine dehydrogenase family protein subunit M [Desulforhopalus singaporensis]SDP32315.1 carbon-monoxide dehydrogenase medium subunit [Desulforhopalus singaporensis]
MKNFIGSRALPEIKYHSPGKMDELLALISGCSGPVKIVAGCTDFIPALRTGRWTFANGVNVIDIKKIDELSGITVEGGMVRIGACTRLTQLVESPEILAHAPVLAQAAAQMASLQVRNSATIGGNICMSSPAADAAPPLLALDASVTLKDGEGEQEVALCDFFTGPGRNVMKPGQVLTRICVPVKKENEAAEFRKIGTRTAVIISVVSAAVRIRVVDGVCRDTRIALGSVAPTPVRVRQAESFLDGKRFNDENIDACAALAAEEITPISDLRASSEYRKDVARTLVKRSVMACRKRLV